ncbi:hypothetical protein NJ959_21525 [Symplocastrum sp. BBK-W-15]|uniref:Uncharacterized protein n=1 Tax=Limnofasciculus baicalensis BBK-W-15 TaxID=2699891 RepID=A0AAE3KPM9_9CYAN|nr:hypothetical protein [Limnofasciculus baicalensis BBK-W-15]
MISRRSRWCVAALTHPTNLKGIVGAVSRQNSQYASEPDSVKNIFTSCLSQNEYCAILLGEN